MNKCKESSEIETRFYTPEEIQKMLRIGRNSTYRIIENAYSSKTNFMVIKLCRQYRIDKKSFDEWLNSL